MVATTKNEPIVRVVVINDTHIHKRRKAAEMAAATSVAKSVEAISGEGTAVEESVVTEKK